MINEGALVRQAVLQKYVPPICQVLPDAEREAFQADPVEFISVYRFFRAMSTNQLAEILQTGKMFPQEGEMASVAVFETDSPYYAARSVGQHGVLAVIDSSRIVGALLDAGTAECKSIIEDKLLHPPSGCDFSDYRYTVYNEVDLKTPLVIGHRWHNIQLRQPQPLEEITHLIINGQTGEPLVIDMQHADQRSWLETKFLSRLCA